jgi:hypothetical protein
MGHQTVRTNDPGEYRLYWMEPGKYIVSVQPPSGFGGVESPGGFNGNT